MFGKSTSKWKTLVTQLKKRINLNPNTTDSDIFSTIIESKQSKLLFYHVHSVFASSISCNFEYGNQKCAVFSFQGVYVHLANTLSLAELEEVLEKGSEDVAKFRSTCKRVELANSYASMVIQISTEYLQNKQ